MERLKIEVFEIHQNQNHNEELVILIPMAQMTLKYDFICVSYWQSKFKSKGARLLFPAEFGGPLNLVSQTNLVKYAKFGGH